jgi:hypothetical protein
MIYLNPSDGKEVKLVMTQTASDVDQVKRSSSPNLIAADYGALHIIQKINRGRTSTDGSPHRIRQLTITLRVVLITRKQQLGSFKVEFSRNGNHQDRFFGSTGNVRPVPPLTHIL